MSTKPPAMVPVVVETAERAERDETSRDFKLPALGSWVWVVGHQFNKYDEKQSFDRGSPQHAKDAEGHYDHEKETLCCVTHIGSNFIQVESLHEESTRVHFDDLTARVRGERNAEAHFKQLATKAQERAWEAMDRVREITAALGVGEASQLPEIAGVATALVRVGDSNKDAAAGYKKSLIKAEKTQLPALFEKIKAELAWSGFWMKAELLPMKATLGQMQTVMGRIKARIFNVALYAGLEEEIVEVVKGKPAPAAEPIRVYQRRLYMDEESLIAYKAGGLEFDKLEDFDAWMAEPENRDRLLPFPRCIVAFRIRRFKKPYTFAGKSLQEYVSFCFESSKRDEQNMRTFLYMRNGESLYRLATEIDFGEQLYPDDVTYSLAEGQAYTDQQGEHVISQGDYEQRCAEYDRAKKEHRWTLACSKWGYRRLCKEYPQHLAEYQKALAEWEVAHAAWEKDFDVRHAEVQSAHEAWQAADEAWFERNDHSPRPVRPALVWPKRSDAEAAEPRKPSEPRDYRQNGWGYHTHFHSDYGWDPREVWRPLDQKNTRLDDANESLRNKIDAHNRVVLVLQGLLDRSPVWHPHPPWRLWDEGGFKAALVLIKDSSRALDEHGPRPDYKAYCARLLSELTEDSVVSGQRLAFGRREAAKYNEKASQFDPGKSIYYPIHNPGPPTIGKPTEWKTKGGRLVAAVFRWEKESERERRVKIETPLKRKGWVTTSYEYVRAKMDDKIVVPVEGLFNLSAYKPGDFKQFFANIHTRADYVKWAPQLFAAEDWHAIRDGRLKQKKGDDDEYSGWENEQPDDDDD